MMSRVLAAAPGPGCGAERAGGHPLRGPLAGTRPAGSRVARGSCRAWVLAVVVTAIACALAGCGSASSVGRGTQMAREPRHGWPVWLLTRSALSQLAADPAIRAVLQRSRVYEILWPGQRPLAGFGAIPVVTFPAIPALAAAVAAKRIPAGAHSLLYDPEAWPLTPAGEQRDPVQAATRAAALARAHDLGLIVVPALNLTKVIGPRGRTPRWRRFLDLRLAASFARTSNFVGLQAQSLERNTVAYAAFVREAAGQARAANRHVTVVAGLSTNPPGARVSSQQLLAAIRATRSAVDGYWLNIPGPGPRCPTCNPARPQIARQALRARL